MAVHTCTESFWQTPTMSGFAVDGRIQIRETGACLAIGVDALDAVTSKTLLRLETLPRSGTLFYMQQHSLSRDAEILANPDRNSDVADFSRKAEFAERRCRPLRNTRGKICADGRRAGNG